MFFVVSVTVMTDPGAALEEVESADTCRSGTTIVIGVVIVLLVSIDSGTVCPPSASAIRYQDPGAALAGIVTVVEPELLIPAARAPAERLPIKVSPESKVLLRER